MKTKKINHGKRFEKDFQDSAEKVMFIYRLRDPGSSFNIKCQDCPKQVTRFSFKNMCDFIAFSTPMLYLLELKSTKSKSFPFASIMKNEKDKRIEQMVIEEKRRSNVKSYIVFNFRGDDNLTYAVTAFYVLNYMKMGLRKSIPFDFIEKHGIMIASKKKLVRYSYDIDRFIRSQF